MVGRRVTEERTRRGISQRAMAREMGISAPRLSQLESGEAWTVATLCDAARVIGVQQSELMREQEALRDEERRVIDLITFKSTTIRVVNADTNGITFAVIESPSFKAKPGAEVKKGAPPVP